MGGIKYKMNVGWVEAWNPTPDYVTLPLTHPTNNCASLLRYDVLLLRDTFNLIASRLKKGFLSVKTKGMSLTDMWIEYAKEFLEETSYLSNNKVIINYNLWFSDISYRREIWFFVTWYGSIGGHKSTKSLSGKRLNWLVRSR